MIEEPRQLLFNSKFEDWINASNQMLVLTWDVDVNLSSVEVLHDTPVTDLQIWDVDSDTLTKVIPGGIWGRISPDRRYLVYLQPSSNFPTLQLLDRNSGQVIFAQPAFAEFTRFSGEVDAFASFSPDGRFLTYFDSGTNLVIFDLESGKSLSTFQAKPVTPIWSPSGTQLVYEDMNNGTAIFDV
jgi:Tol biopolymer transport system component